MSHDQSHHIATFAGQPQFQFSTVNTRGHWEKYGNKGTNWGNIRISPKGAISFDFTEVGSGKGHVKRTMVHLEEAAGKALVEFILQNCVKSS